MKQREERINEQKKNQEERIRKALERARAEPKKFVSYSKLLFLLFVLNKQTFLKMIFSIVKMGRRLMARSKPPVTVKLDKRAIDEANKIDEELAYFFT